MALYIDKNIYVGDTGVQLSALGEIANKAPKSHASSGTTYGVGTTSNYGHCRVINNLTTSSATNGYALQAYQGKVLNDKIAGVATSLKDAAYLKGVYTIIPKQITSTNNNSATRNFQIYRLKDELISAFPEREGFSRLYYLHLMWTNNHNRGTKFYLRGDVVAEGSIWGSTDGTYGINQYWDITTFIKNCPTGHCDFAASNVNGGTTIVYFGEILIYDVPNNI